MARYSPCSPADILFVETIGAYLLARCYIQDADDFFNMARSGSWRFSFLSSRGGTVRRNFLLERFAAILPSYPD